MPSYSSTAPYLVSFLSYLTFTNIVTLKSGLEVSRGYWKWYHLKAWLWFPIHIPWTIATMTVSSAISTQYTNVTDRQTDIQPVSQPPHDDTRQHLWIATHGKKWL